MGTPTISSPLDRQCTASSRQVELLAGAYFGLSALTLAAIIALPGFPLWMKPEQGVAGLCLVGIAVLASHGHLRSGSTTK